MPEHVDASRDALLAICSFVFFVVRAPCFILIFFPAWGGGGVARLSFIVIFSLFIQQTTSGIGHLVFFRFGNQYTECEK